MRTGAAVAASVLLLSGCAPREPASDATDIELGGGTEVVEAAGRYLIPGLFDMHVHLFAPWGDGVEAELARHRASGVLGVRDLGMPMDSIPRLRAILDSASTSVARVWYTGPVV
jgi:imidazolonepropionase-like amidohydrolase